MISKTIAHCLQDIGLLIINNPALTVTVECSTNGCIQMIHNRTIVHNDYSREIPHVFEIYSGKIVILQQTGDLSIDMTEEEFYLGFQLSKTKS